MSKSIFIVVLSLLFTITAFTQSVRQNEGKSFWRDGYTYLNLQGSYLLDSKLKEIVGGSSATAGTTEGDIPNDFGFGVAIGRSFPLPGQNGQLLMEGEYLFHPGNEIQEFGGLEFDNEFNTQAYMANIHWSLPIKFIETVLGGGIGSTKLTLKTTPIDSQAFEPFENSVTGFVYQLKAKVNFPISDLITVGLGYRLFKGNDVNEDVVDPTNNERINISYDVTAHRGEIGIDIRF